MPDLTVIVTTYDRPERLRSAVASALAQTVEVEVLVVDDSSPTPPRLPHDPRLRLVRHRANLGVSAARNTGAQAARSRFVTFLDDDDELLPAHAEVTLAAQAEAKLPAPVGVLTAIEVVDETGRPIETRVPPPALPKGGAFSLEPTDPRYSYFTKQTLVVDRGVLLGIGGFDTALRSRVTTEVFWRLNRVCSLVGLEQVTYRHVRHRAARISDDPLQRRDSLRYLVEKHAELLRAHPEGAADLLVDHALVSYRHGRRREALAAVARAAGASPRRAAGRLAYAARQALRSSVDRSA